MTAEFAVHPESRMNEKSARGIDRWINCSLNNESHLERAENNEYVAWNNHWEMEAGRILYSLFVSIISHF